MSCGKVIKTQNSFYYVKVGEELFVCKLRGKFKKKESVVTGDEVDFAVLADGSGVIEQRLPRRNCLIRPPVANIDQVVLVFAAKEPDPSLLLLDRFLVLAEWSRINEIILCFNKVDLVDSDCRTKMKALYEGIGYKVILTSTYEELGLTELKQALNNKVTVFAGPSGVGKSSLLNKMESGFSLQTGGLSDKIKRGRHTTRVAQLLSFGDAGYLVDTPGFSMVDFENMSEHDLLQCMPEMLSYTGRCRYYGCSHSHEPECRVKEAVEEGLLERSRYDSYLNILQEIRENQKRRK